MQRKFNKFLIQVTTVTLFF